MPEKILVVDDEQDIADLLENVYKRQAGIPLHFYLLALIIRSRHNSEACAR